MLANLSVVWIPQLLQIGTYCFPGTLAPRPRPWRLDREVRWAEVVAVAEAKLHRLENGKPIAEESRSGKRMSSQKEGNTSRSSSSVAGFPVVIHDGSRVITLRFPILGKQLRIHEHQAVLEAYLEQS
ncbi:unnamed protein product [Cylicocyclus nassatus]|uniref:Uncharacterized protein n=1 Tax=Cylicocyclus nassatus TaxID=53992 RepID=A0AA36DKG5_CYLNA|nr:unnamed protein product [Cylicocyclus nassatus]